MTARDADDVRPPWWEYDPNRKPPAPAQDAESVTVYDVAVEVIRTGECPDCKQGAIHVCPLLVRDLVRAALLIDGEADA